MSELAVTSALQLHVPVPGDATPMTAPAVSLDAMPTAELVIARAWKLGPGGDAAAVCARADASLWIDGLEAPVLDGASALVRKQLDAPALSAGAVVREGLTFVQGFEGHGFVGRHRLGFSAGDAVVCSVVCRGPDCGWLEQMALRGELTPAPAGVLAIAARHPRMTLVVAGMLAVVIMVMVVRRRPRPAW